MYVCMAASTGAHTLTHAQEGAWPVKKQSSFLCSRQTSYEHISDLLVSHNLEMQVHTQDRYC